MAEPREVQLNIMGERGRGGNSNGYANSTNKSTIFQDKNYKWWARISVYTLFVLAGQSAATLLGRLYFDKGGKSTWTATLVQPAGFPILLPLYFISRPKNPPTNNTITEAKSPSLLILVSIYVSLGALLAADCMLYARGLLYLPVSTYSLICASQLAFNAFFSFFLNSQKFTPFVVNSLFLLTLSSTLLMFQNDSSNAAEVSKKNYALGFICTIGASAGYGLMLSLTQFVFRKVIKKETFKVVLDMIVFQSLVGTCVILIGFFASGDWKSFNTEMEEFKLGKVSFLMTLIWTAICWQVFSIGAVGLIFEVSSLFSNVISTLGLPVVPILAVFVFHDNMSGIKVVAMILALWGFISYIYQHYLDDRKSETEIG